MKQLLYLVEFGDIVCYSMYICICIDNDSQTGSWRLESSLGVCEKKKKRDIGR